LRHRLTPRGCSLSRNYQTRLLNAFQPWRPPARMQNGCHRKSEIVAFEGACGGDAFHDQIKRPQTMSCEARVLDLRSAWFTSCRAPRTRSPRLPLSPVVPGMPLQNRVTPFGEIIATSARGLFMGNRGRLHDENRTLRRPFTSEQRWLICKTIFKDRHRTPMTPGQYTELFFLDEATALAAGNRPCAECRHADYVRFKEFWRATNRRSRGRHRGGSTPIGAEQIDSKLQQERRNADGSKRQFPASCDDLPNGVFVTLATGPDAYLVWLKNSFIGRRPASTLTVSSPGVPSLRCSPPRSTLRVIAAGYEPVVHPTVLTARHDASSRTILSDDLE
jgi:hypothetical protein